MNRLFCWTLLAAILLQRGLGIPTNTEPTDEDDDDWDEDDESTEADDDGRIYKNPRNSPSTECPRDEEQATLLSQKCLRKCSSDEDCKSKKKKCLCDGACGMSCIKPDRECRELEVPENATITLSGRHFGARATYTCIHGFHVVGLQSRLCQADGQWAGQEPACKQNIYCLAPPTIEHARHSALPEQATFDLDATVQYTCHTGYVTAGFPRAKCLAIDGRASWYGPDIQCEPRSCGQPADPGHSWHAGECYTYGCRITYHCSEGYELVGKIERFCQADGNWTPKEMPTCVLVTSVQCSPPEDPKNGKAIYTSCSYNSVVSYECKYGHTLIGESSRRCGADRKWSGTMPVCKEINCGHPGILYNGWLENIESGTGLGASIIFRCHTDMLLVGNTSTQCQPSGWNYNLPKCLAPCVVPTISQGTVIPMEIEMDPNATTTYAPPTLATATNKVKHGTTLDVICEDHYEFPISSLAAPTCNNGTWSIIPRCVPARCKGLPRPPKYGMVLAPKTEHGMKARFKCKDGYNLTGPGGKEITDYNDYVLTCSFGNWTGETPMCQEVYCSFPGYIPNGKVLLVGNMGLYDYRPYVKKIVNNKQIMYDCDKGYVLDSGPPGATCVGSLWRPTELPSCLLGQHPRLRWNRRRRRSINLKFNPSGTVLKNYRQLLAHLNELNQKENNDFLIRTKKTKNRNTLFYRGQRTRKDRQKRIRRMASQAYEKDHSNHIRSRRDESKIHNHNHHNNPLDLVRSMWHENLMEKYKHYMESILPTKPGHHRNNNTNNKLDFMHYQQFKLNNIFADEAEHYKLNGKYQQKLSNRIGQKEQNTNYLPNTKHSKPIHHNAWNLDWSVIKKNLNDNNMMRPVSLTKRLKSEKRNQRKKRNTDDLLLTYMDNNGKKGKPKEPCTPLTNQPYMRIDMIREGRDPNNMYSAGTILKITCAKEYKLNLQNPNGTAKCVRGRWKPMKPECQLLPCSVPSTEHGSYYNESTFGYVNVSKSMEPKTPLIAFEEIQNGNSIRFQCDMGFTVQGSTELNCIDGQWNVGILPECLPSPCTLPTINNAVYQEGYRGGLNIAHGSFVNIQCENPATNQPVQMTCALGTLTPPTIHCETGARRSREEYLGEVEFVSTGQEINNILNSLNVKLNSGPGNAQGVTGVGNSGVGGSSIIHSANASGNINNNNSNHIVNSVYRSNFATGRDCGSPSKMDNALVYRNGDPVGEMDSGFQSGTEITFNCISSTAGERTTWKIICEDGTWVGRSLNCANGTCIYRNNEPNVVSFYNDLEIREDIVEFPPGATIVSRCVDIGKYTMVGNNVRTCIHSEWTGQRPACFGLNQENDYAMEKSPTILFRHQNGPIAQSNDGKLIVYPGTTIHMECLWMRRFGNPKWIVNHEYRTYPEGWVTEDGRDTQLEYRLSIFHAVEDDSGIFTCQTPARHEHSIDIVVKAINCPEIPNRRGLIINKNDTKLSSRIQLSCANGNSLIGASELLCTPSGNWSAPLPVCESVECGDIPLSQSGNRSIPRVAVLSREVGGRAAFSCQLGYGLNGPSESICLPSGEWATPFPTCLEVQCENPGAPANGYAQGSAPYRAGDVVQFNCNPEYMMQGQPIIACQDNGRWSGGLPKCVQACSYPGTAIAGRMSSVKFYYGIGESITFSCDPGLELRGAKQLKCLRNGKWSNAIPTCVNLESSQNKNEN